MKTTSAVKAALISFLGGIIITGCTVEKTPDTTVVNPTTPVVEKPSTTVVTPAAPSTSHTDVHVSAPPATAPASTTTTTGG